LQHKVIYRDKAQRSTPTPRTGCGDAGATLEIGRFRSGVSGTEPPLSGVFAATWLRRSSVGFMPVNVVHGAPLFAGFGNSVLIREFHAYEVTQLPAEFELLASTAETRVQVIKHKDKPLYGTQFHPERYDAEHLDGERLLRNFLRLAGLPAGAAATP
jgi:hypothetical protein